MKRSNGTFKVEANYKSKSQSEADCKSNWGWDALKLLQVFAMHKFYLHFYIIFVLLTQPRANTWPQKPDIISFYGIRVEFFPQQQQSKHVCHNHMWRLTDFPITYVRDCGRECVWVSVCGVYLHTQTSICIGGSLRVCVCCGSVHFWILHNNLWCVRCDFSIVIVKNSDRQYQPNWDSLRMKSVRFGSIRYVVVLFWDLDLISASTSIVYFSSLIGNAYWWIELKTAKMVVTRDQKHIFREYLVISTNNWVVWWSSF